MPPLLCADRSCKMPLQPGWDFCPYCGADNRLSPGPVPEHGCPDHMPFPEGHCTRCGVRTRADWTRVLNTPLFRGAGGTRLRERSRLAGSILFLVLLTFAHWPKARDIPAARAVVLQAYENARQGRTGDITGSGWEWRQADDTHGRVLWYRLRRRHANYNPFSRALWTFAFDLDVQREQAWTRERAYVHAGHSKYYGYRTNLTGLDILTTGRSASR